MVSAGEPVGDGVHPQYIGFAVSGASHTEILAFYLSDTCVFGRVDDTLGAAGVVDIGVARGSASSLYAFGGGRDYLGTSGIPASGVTHRVVSDVLGYYYIPILSGDGGVDFYFDVVADTGASTYVAQTFSVTVANGALVQRDVTLGLLAGGGVCDDLSGIGVTANVDYAQHIQPIWDAQCGGCHTQAGGSAGLGLLGPDSWMNLVSVPSTEVGGLMLVQPGDASLSYLFEKVNCAQPQVGVRMRVGSPMSLADQALIRDWINQGANPPSSGSGGGGGSGAEDSSGCAITHGTGWAWLAGLLALATTLLLVSQRLRTHD